MIFKQIKKTFQQENGKLRRPLVITAILSAVILVAVVTYLVSVGLGPNNRSVGLSPFHKKTTILILGVNQHKSDTGYANVTCIVTLNPDTKDITMLWVPQDSRVKVPGHGWQKIGQAYTDGGYRLAEKTVSDLLGIPIDYYVEINMDNFAKIIDILGGIDIDVEKRMYYSDPYDEDRAHHNGLIDLHPGLQHMNGHAVLEYVRFRDSSADDAGRIERQQKISKTLLAQAASPAVAARMPALINEINAAIHTDLPLNQMLNIGKMLNDAYKRGLNTDVMSGKAENINGISYWVLDIMAVRRQIGEIQEMILDDKYMDAAHRLAREYENSVSREMPAATTTEAVAPPASPLPQTAENVKQGPAAVNGNTLPANDAQSSVNINNKKSAPPDAANPSETKEAPPKNNTIISNDKHGIKD